MALDVKDITDSVVGREKSLSRSGLLKRSISRSFRRVGWCEFSARIVRPPSCPMTSFDAGVLEPLGVGREFVDRHPFGDEANFFRSLRVSFSAAGLFRLD